MSATRPIINAVQECLQKAIPNVIVEVFPDRPDEYRFIHPIGAVLVGYQGSRFGKIDGLAHINQQRDITLDLTVIGRNLHGDTGTLSILDDVRLAIVGFKPPACLPCHLLSEEFLAEHAGAWMYSLKVQTETQQVEQCRQPDNLPKLVAVRYRHKDDPLAPDLKPKKG